MSARNFWRKFAKANKGITPQTMVNYGTGRKPHNMNKARRILRREESRTERNLRKAVDCKHKQDCPIFSPSTVGVKEGTIAWSHSLQTYRRWDGAIWLDIGPECPNGSESMVHVSKPSKYLEDLVAAATRDQLRKALTHAKIKGFRNSTRAEMEAFIKTTGFSEPGAITPAQLDAVREYLHHIVGI